MKGIYLTEEGKKAIEDKIAELEKEGDVWSPCFGIAMDVYQKILSTATVLPVEESWENIESKLDSNVYRPTLKGNLPLRINKYPKGVIIEPKNKQS